MARTRLVRQLLKDGRLHSRDPRATVLAVLAVLAIGGAGLEAGEPSPAAREVAERIRHEALLPPRGPAGRPLPLLGHWNMGGQGQGWTPQYQLELLDQGTPLLPWLGWPQADPDKDEKAAQRFRDYYEEWMTRCRQLRLPISFRGTQWEAVLVGKEYRQLPPEECPAVITPEGQAINKLCPFGPIDKWRDPAAVYVDTPAMKLLQQWYPDPPLVLFVSNNEAPDLRWHQAETLSQRYRDRFGTGRSDEFKRQAVARGWMERYPVMFQAMRDALVSDAWKKNVRFVGYGAFGPSHFGRWDGWKEYSLITDQWTSPDWHIWDGGSPSYYTHNWCPNRDHWVWSTQVESMNWIFQLDEAWRVNPNFWWEVSIWDGNQSWKPNDPFDPKLLPNSKACQYMNDGQTYTPERYRGWVQFGMWLLRPRVVREFRGSTVPREPWRAYFDELIAAVKLVHADDTLAEFWRHGELVANPSHEHPFQDDIPEKYRETQRWFLLDTDLDAPRPWDRQTDIPVFSLALVRGMAGSRQWLLYAHSPLADHSNVAVTIPEFGTLTVGVPRAGAFYLVEESGRRVTLKLHISSGFAPRRACSVVR